MGKKNRSNILNFYKEVEKILSFFTSFYITTKG